MARTKKIDVQALVAQHEQRAAKWKVLVRTDPRRAVRALKIVGFSGESIEGDTVWDGPHIIGHLKTESAQPRSEVWRRLVDAGVFDSICFSVCHSTNAAFAKRGSPEAGLEAQAREQVFSGWFEPFQIICNAVLQCGDRVTSTEQRMLDDIRKNWTSVMERIWTQPIFCLEIREKSMIERTMLAQVAIRLTYLDSAFIGVYLKHTDLTFPVCFRNWLHSTTTSDSQLNARLLMPALDPHLAPQHWKRYTNTHRCPTTAEMLARVVLGASKESGARRHSPPQMAEAIVNATIKHLDFPGTNPDLQVLELKLLHALYVPSKTDFTALPPVIYQSAELWMNVVRVLRHAANAGFATGTKDDETTYLYALQFFTVGLFEKNSKYLDALVAGWIVGGLFDALEESIDFLLTCPVSGFKLTMVLQVVSFAIPKLTPRTQALLKLQFPRPLLTFKVAREQTGSREQQMFRQASFMARVDGTGNLDPENPVWREAAHEILLDISEKALVLHSSACVRKGCQQRVSSWSKVGCDKCKRVQYCSDGCLKRDAVHKECCTDARRVDYDVAKFAERTAQAMRPAKRRMMYLRLLRISFAVLRVGFPLVVVGALLWAIVVVSHDLWLYAAEFD